MNAGFTLSIIYILTRINYCPISPHRNLTKDIDIKNDLSDLQKNFFYGCALYLEASPPFSALPPFLKASVDGTRSYGSMQ